MMLRDLVDADRVHLGLEARDLTDALEAAAATIEAETGLEKGQIVQALLDRERLGSTSVGEGFAIPHCKMDDLRDLALSLVRFSEPLDFGAPDEEPVRFFFVVLSPPDQPAEHLRVLSQIARVLKRRDLRSNLLSADDSRAVVAAVHDALDAEDL